VCDRSSYADDWQAISPSTASRHYQPRSSVPRGCEGSSGSPRIVARWFHLTGRRAHTLLSIVRPSDGGRAWGWPAFSSGAGRPALRRLRSPAVFVVVRARVERMRGSAVLMLRSTPPTPEHFQAALTGFEHGPARALTGWLARVCDDPRAGPPGQSVWGPEPCANGLAGPLIGWGCQPARHFQVVLPRGFSAPQQRSSATGLSGVESGRRRSARNPERRSTSSGSREAEARAGTLGRDRSSKGSASEP
jgi:hypothetical protein